MRLTLEEYVKDLCEKYQTKPASVIAAAVAYEAASVELCAAIEAQFAPKGDVLELFDADTRRSRADTERLCAQARLVRAVRVLRNGGW